MILCSLDSVRSNTHDFSLCEEAAHRRRQASLSKERNMRGFQQVSRDRLMGISLLFLNDDTSVIHPDWLDAMMEHAVRPEVGVVGSLLLFPDDRIQHAGVVMGLYGLAGHSFRLLDSRESHYFHFPMITRNCSAVTGACLLTRAKVFWEVDGFEERELPMAFQDVDLCLKLHEHGYRIIYTPHTKLQPDAFQRRIWGESLRCRVPDKCRHGVAELSDSGVTVTPRPCRAGG